MHIRNRCVFTLFLAAGTACSLLVAPASFALPPDPQLDQWNGNPIERLIWNCYNYGVNRMTTDANGIPVRAHPGKGMAWPNMGQNLTSAQWCDKVKARAQADGLKVLPWSPGDPIPQPGTGQNLVALGVLAGGKGTGGDYHWWRRNGDGSWSHKRGSTAAKTTYTDKSDPANPQEKPLTDPREAGQRDGYDLCAFMAYSKNPPPDIGALAALMPSCNPPPSHAVIFELAHSGVPDEEAVLPPQRYADLIPILENSILIPMNEIPDPQWPGVHAGESAGFLMTLDPVFWNSQGHNVPLTVRVFDGAIEAFHYRPDLDRWDWFYYIDELGFFGDWLDFQHHTRHVGLCRNTADGSSTVTTPCACEQFGATFCFADWNGDGVVDSDDLFSFLFDWARNDADYNGDGVTDSDDLFEFLFDWADGC